VWTTPAASQKSNSQKSSATKEKQDFDKKKQTQTQQLRKTSIKHATVIKLIRISRPISTRSYSREIIVDMIKSILCNPHYAKTNVGVQYET